MMKTLMLSKRWEGFEKQLAAIAFVSILALAAILIFLLSQAVPLFRDIGVFQFLFGTQWYPSGSSPDFEIGALLVASLCVAATTTFISLPIGLLTAAYLAYFASPYVRQVVKPAIELLAALPSVIVGFLGMVLLAPWLQNTLGLDTGLNWMNASVMLSLMCVPFICSISEDALRNVPTSLSEASLALGATRWETLYKVQFRYAMGGIGTAVMLGISRALGETMVVLMVAGGAAIIPESFFDPLRPMTASIAAEMAEAAVGSTHYHALFATGLVLFITTFVFNAAAFYFTKKYQFSKR